jgi:hypothetical protein
LEGDSNPHQSPTSKLKTILGDSNPGNTLLPSALDHLPSERSEVKFFVTLSSPYSEVDDEGIEAEERRVDVTWDYAPNLGDWQHWLKTYNEMEGGEYYFHDVRLVNWEMEM